MKCVKNVVDAGIGFDEASRIKRVDDVKAAFMVNHGPYEYCSKSEWKEHKHLTKENN